MGVCQQSKTTSASGAIVKVLFNNKEILEILLKLNFHVHEKNQPGNICLRLSCVNFDFLRQIRLQPRDDIDE